jgi:hypothetical protein
LEFILHINMVWCGVVWWKKALPVTLKLLKLQDDF